MKACIRIAIVVLFTATFLAAQSVAPPPKPLRLVGDHWTPYDPPTEFPEGSTVHVVERGDTLWDLARKHLGDPYLWPQIWERNPYILDSHWIYPGDPIVIDVAVQQPGVAEEEVVPGETVVSEYEEAPYGEGAEQPFDEYEVVPRPEESPYPLGSRADVYCFARLVEDQGVFPFSIVSAERAVYQSQFSEGDVVYLDGGVEEGVSAGDRFGVLHYERPLNHPVSQSKMGLIYSQVAHVQVLCAQEHSSIAEITYACDPVEVGDVLEPFSPVPVPLVILPDAVDRCDDPSGKPTGYVVYNRDNVVDASIEHIVMLDLGNAEGLYPGQFITVFRDNPAKGFPRLVIGELGILTVEEGYSTAKVVRGWGPVYVGDRVEVR